MAAEPARLISAAFAATAVVFASVMVASASADTVASHRLTGNGGRNHEFLTVDVRVAGSNVTGVATLGMSNGSEVCTYHSFANGVIDGTSVSFDATGSCTANKPGFSHNAAHHRIAITDLAGGDSIDVNALPDSASGITIPGGTVTFGNYYLH